MLYFSKLKIVFIYLIIIFFSIFAITNFINTNNISFLSKKVNLGLDLQGGSYLLLEVDTNPIVKQKLQNKLISLKKSLKKEKIKYKNLILNNQNISFSLPSTEKEKFDKFFFNKENLINSYYNQYKSYELDYSINNNVVIVSFTKFGIIEIKNTALDQSMEIVRRRIDEVGTKDPTILKRGNDRILIELPGLDDPARIKKLLGKTANLSFRLVTDKDDSFGSELLFFEDEKGELRVSKRVIMSGDNLVNARPSFDNRNNDTR